jgi:hypothetical protein
MNTLHKSKKYLSYITQKKGIYIYFQKKLKLYL